MLCSCTISLIGIVFDINSIIIPILCFVASIGGFIGGVYLCKILFNKKITEIFTKLKEKNILYMSLEDQYAKTSSSDNSEEKSHSSSSSSKSNENDLEEKEMSGIRSNSEQSSSEEEYDSDSSEKKLTKKTVYFSKTTLNKINLKKDLFDSMEDISNKYNSFYKILIYIILLVEHH